MQTRKRRKGFESKPTTSARAARAWREILKAVLPSHFQDLISLVLSYCGVGIAGNLLAIRPEFDYVRYLVASSDILFVARGLDIRRCRLHDLQDMGTMEATSVDGDSVRVMILFQEWLYVFRDSIGGRYHVDGKFLHSVVWKGSATAACRLSSTGFILCCNTITTYDLLTGSPLQKFKLDDLSFTYALAMTQHESIVWIMDCTSTFKLHEGGRLVHAGFHSSWAAEKRLKAVVSAPNKLLLAKEDQLIEIWNPLVRPLYSKVLTLPCSIWKMCYYDDLLFVHSKGGLMVFE